MWVSVYSDQNQNLTELQGHFYELTGKIILGGRTFAGYASGWYHYPDWNDPIVHLSGVADAGNLTAACTTTLVVGRSLNAQEPVSTPAGVGELKCNGVIGTGPQGTVTLYLATSSDGGPNVNPSDRGQTYDHYSGAFRG